MLCSTILCSPAVTVIESSSCETHQPCSSTSKSKSGPESRSSFSLATAAHYVNCILIRTLTGQLSSWFTLAFYTRFFVSAIKVIISLLILLILPLKIT